MNTSAKLLLSTIFGLAGFAPQDAQAWGHKGHQILAEVGSSLAGKSSSFWAANAHNMGILSNVPDQKWKRGASAGREKPTHWFQPDSYFDKPSQFRLFPRVYALAAAQYSAGTLEKNGTAPWRIKQFFDLAVDAIKRGDYPSALEMAGAMSHYIGDLSQPLHVTRNYDGAETGNPGIHKFFETDNLELADSEEFENEVRATASALLRNPQFLAAFQGSIVDSIFSEVDRAYALKDEVIRTDLKFGRRSEGADIQLSIAKDRLADGAATLALVLSKMWARAGSPNQRGATIKLVVPPWPAPNYMDPAPEQSIFHQSSRVEFIEIDDRDDCSP